MRVALQNNHRKKMRQRLGYTLVEVMMARGILKMGAVGIMGLHQASTHANLSAREISTANNVMRTWMERLKRDSLLWNIGGDGAGAANLTSTRYLSEVGNGWFVPDPAAASESHAFDHFGFDTSTNASMRFCINVRVEWVTPGQSLRTEVRVWWPKNSIDASPYAACADGTDPETLTGNTDLHFISAANVVRWYPI
ncbi:MAG: hypothetical protein IPJ88_05130 [Myxococcales bacterium]|nr:MAG: hypothetical protein IPJ88_05130 [Myxococcales bacterium]